MTRLRNPIKSKPQGTTLKGIIQHARAMKAAGMNEKRIAEVTAAKCKEALQHVN